MRDLTDSKAIDEFMRTLGRISRRPARVYLTGGSSAVLFNWRETTIDIELRFEPEHDELFRALPELKERLGVNIELASPPDFIPPLPGWEDRSIFIRREGKLDFYHFDPYSQALAKIERAHAQDISDVQAMFRENMIDAQKLADLFHQIENQLYRYPAIDPATFSKSVAMFAEINKVDSDEL
jgi:hypothetical protein